MLGKGISMLFGKCKVLTLVERNHKNARLRRLHDGFLDHVFRGSYKKKKVRYKYELLKNYGWGDEPIALSLGVGVAEVGMGDFSSFSVIVDVDGFREKVLVRGPKWVSFNSNEAAH